MHRNFAGVIAVAAMMGCGTSGPATSSTSEGALSACAAGDTVKGIDVSKYQGDIDWASVKADGNAFAFVRVSDGVDAPDALFDTNWSGAKSAGLIRGAYQFFRPAQDIDAQANLMVSKLGSLEDTDIPPVLDLEVTDSVDAATIQLRVQQWLTAVENQLGRKPLVYTAAFMASTLGGGFSDYSLWVANYGVSCPKVPSGWTNWSFWQMNDKGSVSGISGAVDVDEFNGSMSDLLAFVGASTSSGGSSGSSGNGGVTPPDDDAGGATPPGDNGGGGPVPPDPPDPPTPPGPPSPPVDDGGTFGTPTWTQIYDQYLAVGSVGACAVCHSQMDTAPDAYSYLQGQGYFGGSIPELVDPTRSPLSWFGGNMPPFGPTVFSDAQNDMTSWAMAGALNN